jgi:hypothetical protein
MPNNVQQFCKKKRKLTGTNQLTKSLVMFLAEAIKYQDKITRVPIL